MANILIVDDEKGIRRTLGEFLRDAGHEVVEAEDADIALQVLKTREIDVVVTDIILPRVTGLELLGRIHGSAPHVQVVMMTGEPTVETATESLQMGATDYLSKPISNPNHQQHSWCWAKLPSILVEKLKSALSSFFTRPGGGDDCCRVDKHPLPSF